MQSIPLHARFRGCLFGLACGDAVGTTLEFKPRGTFTPLTDMIGGGPFRLKPGEWTDDTSMALCLAASLVEKDAFDPYDQMERYVRWMHEGYMSSNGRCFDIGNATSAALNRFEQSRNPFSGSTAPNSAGNGSIMRLAPVPLFYYPDREKAEYYAAESSRTTHGAQECVDACSLLATMTIAALNGLPKADLLFKHHPPHTVGSDYSPRIQAIGAGAYRQKTIDDIRGTGYVVESLEAALWCFWRTDSYESAILAAANLGDDADTTAAVCGQLAGAYYGFEAIPALWRDKVAKFDLIMKLADDLHSHASGNSTCS